MAFKSKYPFEVFKYAELIDRILDDRWTREYLSQNPSSHAVEYLMQHPNHIDCHWFAQNTNPKAIKFALQHKNELNWRQYSGCNNQEMVDYLLLCLDLIDWERFSMNENPKAVGYLLWRPEKINPWFWGNPNPQAVDYIIRHAPNWWPRYHQTRTNKQ